jgi:hypothetical protein
MSPWKYVFDKPLDIINHGIPYNIYNGKIVKEVHVPYMQERYPDRIMECDESGELLVARAIKESFKVPTEPVIEEPVRVIEEKRSLTDLAEEVVQESLKKETVKVAEVPKASPKPIEKKTKPEKTLDPAVAGIKSSTQLKSMFKEDLEELCKKIGISEVGSKGALIKKISAALNIK